MTTEVEAGFVPEITTGHRIRIAREHAGYDQGELAVLTGISRGTIVNYENGVTTHLKPLYLRQIALITGVDAGWLANGVPGSGGTVFRMGKPAHLGSAAVVRFRPAVAA